MWDGVSFLELMLPAKFRSNVCGLCGNFNGDPSDDFQGRDGVSVFEDGQSFGDDWRVGGLRACSVLPRDMQHSYEPHCTQSWEHKIKSDRNCNALNSTLFGACLAKVDPGYYYNACKLDTCECPGETCHCEVLTAYARECERAGTLVHNWREATGCLNVTSYRWNGKHFFRNHSEKPDRKAAANDVLRTQEAVTTTTLSPVGGESESVAGQSDKDARRSRQDTNLSAEQGDKVGAYLPGE